MTHPLQSGLLALLLTPSIACAPPVTPVKPEVLMEADRAFARATAQRGAEGWASFFAENGRMLPDAKTEVIGRADIRKAMESAFSDPTFSLTWAPDGAEVSSAGDLGYTWGRYTSHRVSAEGEETTSRGRYLTIWRRQADGTWKVELDLGNTE